MNGKFFLYLAVMALVTYLIRMLPFVLVKKKIENKFVLSFLYYIPYAVLGVMTVPAIFYSTDSFLASVIGFLSAVALAYMGKGLLTVSIAACTVVFVVELFF